MKKKIFLLIVVLIGIFVNIGVIDAASLKIAGGKISAGKSIDLDISIDGDDLSEYSKVEFYLQVDPDQNASISSINSNVATGYSFKNESGKYVFEIPNGTTITSLQANTLGSVSIKTTESLNDKFNVTPTNVKFYKPDGTIEVNAKVSVGTVEYEAPKSAEAYLTSLKVNSGELSPEFDAETTEYSVIVKDTINSIRIEATPCSKAEKTGTGTHKLEMGENKIDIVVTAEDGTTTKTYTLTVVRGEIAKPSAYLESLIVNNIGCEMSPEFEKNLNKYTVTIPDEITELDFKYELEDAMAEVKIEGNKDFIDGENLVTITVIASDKSETQIYEITVLKEQEESTEIITPVQDEEEKKPKYWLIIILGVLVLGIVSGVAFILFRKKKIKKNNKNTKKEKEPKITINDEVNNSKLSEDLDKTTTYKKENFKIEKDTEEEIEKTKEFNFKDMF